MKIELPKKRPLKKESQYLEHDKGFNHALSICKDMARDQGFEVEEVEEF